MLLKTKYPGTGIVFFPSNTIPVPANLDIYLRIIHLLLSDAFLLNEILLLSAQWEMQENSIIE